MSYRVYWMVEGVEMNQQNFDDLLFAKAVAAERASAWAGLRGKAIEVQIIDSSGDEVSRFVMGPLSRD